VRPPRWITRKRFHAFRLTIWAIQVPPAAFTALKGSLTYLVFLSLAALIESAGTDLDQAIRDEKEDQADSG
jgi:hypothetical protein